MGHGKVEEIKAVYRCLVLNMKHVTYSVSGPCTSALTSTREGLTRPLRQANSVFSCVVFLGLVGGFER